MNRLLLAALAIGSLAAAVALSTKLPADNTPNTPTAFQIARGEKNPWTHLKAPSADSQFQFAVVSDRAGGHRAKIFSKAVHQINLLQPDFVMSVGDLIEGYTTKEEDFSKQWDEFDGYVKKLEMPFFYVPGNHDLANKTLVEYWGGRYGKSHFHFVYRDTLFLNVNTEDGKASKVSAEQAASIAKALDENKNVRWTMVFLHRPLWTEKDLEANGWLAVEKLLAGRKYTVFCGHLHRYQKYVRNGMNYYQLATTGGVSRLRGVEYGEFDHVAWITMKPDGPVIANILLDGILPENLELPEVEETGTVIKKQPLHTLKGKLVRNGKPLAGLSLVFAQQDTPKGFRVARAEGLTGADGSFVVTTYEKFDGIPAGKYRVSVGKPRRVKSDVEKPEELPVPEKYTKTSTSPLLVEIKEGTNEIVLNLTD